MLWCYGLIFSAFSEGVHVRRVHPSLLGHHSHVGAVKLRVEFWIQKSFSTTELTTDHEQNLNYFFPHNMVVDLCHFPTTFVSFVSCKHLNYWQNHLQYVYNMYNSCVNVSAILIRVFYKSACVVPVCQIWPYTWSKLKFDELSFHLKKKRISCPGEITKKKSHLTSQ